MAGLEQKPEKGNREIDITYLIETFLSDAEKEAVDLYAEELIENMDYSDPVGFMEHLEDKYPLVIKATEKIARLRIKFNNAGSDQ